MIQMNDKVTNNLNNADIMWAHLIFYIFITRLAVFVLSD